MDLRTCMLAQHTAFFDLWHYVENHVRTQIRDQFASLQLTQMGQYLTSETKTDSSDSSTENTYSTTTSSRSAGSFSTHLSSTLPPSFDVPRRDLSRWTARLTRQYCLLKTLTLRWPSPELVGEVIEETKVTQALVKMFRHDMIAQGLLYHDFPDDQDGGKKSLVVPSIIKNPFTAEGWAKWAILGACGMFRQMLDAKGGDTLALAQYVDYPIDNVLDDFWEQMEARLSELQAVSRPLQTG